jgi:hypothetical protein
MGASAAIRARAGALLAAVLIVAGCAPLAPVTRPPEPPAPAAPPVPEVIRPAEPRPAPAGPLSPEVEEEFLGHYRASAKTEYAMLNGTLAPPEDFADLEALKAFLQPQIDPLMRHRYPHLSTADTDAGHRVPEERHNVTVIGYIHAVKHEAGKGGDRDFHVMLGSSPSPGAGIFMTAEASALPASGPHRLLLAEARRELLATIGTCHCDGRFRQVSPPIRVRVTGSLFFDGAHGIGSVGPAYAKPFTVWEIHPILSVESN